MYNMLLTNTYSFYQDALYKEHSSGDKIQATVAILTKSYKVFKEHKVDPKVTVTIGYLEAVAGIRFSLMEIANLLHSQCSGAQDHFSWHDQSEFELLQLAENVCTDPAINTKDFTVSGRDVVGPAVYLLKLLVRKYGFPCLKQVSGKLNWIIPKGLCTSDQVCINQSLSTLFLIYPYNVILLICSRKMSLIHLCYTMIPLNILC